MPIRSWLSLLAIVVLGSCVLMMVLGRYDQVDRVIALASFLVSLIALQPSAMQAAQRGAQSVARVPKIALSSLVQAGLLGGTLSGVLAAAVYFRQLTDITFETPSAVPEILTLIVVFSVGCGILLSTVTYLVIRAVFSLAARLRLQNAFIFNEVLSGAIGGTISGMIAGPVGGIIFGTKDLPVVASLETLLATLPGVLCIFFVTLLLIGHRASVTAAAASLAGLAAVFIAAFFAYQIADSVGLVEYAVMNFLFGDVESVLRGGFALGALFGVVYGIGLGVSALAWRLVKAGQAKKSMPS